jgi:hypothetical protein
LIIKITQVTTHPLGPPLYREVDLKQLIQQRGGGKGKNRPKSFKLPLPAELLPEFTPK